MNDPICYQTFHEVELGNKRIDWIKFLSFLGETFELTYIWYAETFPFVDVVSRENKKNHSSFESCHSKFLVRRQYRCDMRGARRQQVSFDYKSESCEEGPNKAFAFAC